MLVAAERRHISPPLAIKREKTLGELAPHQVWQLDWHGVGSLLLNRWCGTNVLDGNRVLTALFQVNL